MGASPPEAAAPLRRLDAAALLLALALAPAALSAQALAVADLRGRVLRDSAGVGGAMVTLHRVTAAEAGPLDSLRSGADGGFTFRLPSVPDPGGTQEVYFASVEYGGVTYFGQAIHMAAQLDSLYAIEVHDSEVAPADGADLPLQVRYTILEPDSAGWLVTDLLGPLNEGERTLVAAEGGVTWRYPLPPEGADFAFGDGGPSTDQGAFEDGWFRVTSPIPPGERQLVLTYHVDEPALTLRYPGRTAVAELLVREPGPPLEVAGLTPTESVEMEPGVGYRRWVGDGLADATVTVAEGEGPVRLPLRWLAVGLAMVLTIAGLVRVMRPHPGAAPAGAAAAVPLTPYERRQALLLEIARLDDARAAGELPDEDAYADRRRALLDRLGALG